MRSQNINKWNLRGWKLEPNYSPRTLVGDWYEERRTFDRKSIPSLSTYKMDYQNCTSSRDWRTLWSIKCKQEGGLGTKHLMDNHSDKYLKDRLSTYNLEYSEPFKAQSIRYQPRKWDRHHSVWVPEKLDLPLPKGETLYGMIQQMKSDLHDDYNLEKNTTKSFVLPTNSLRKVKFDEPKLSYRHVDSNKLGKKLDKA